MFPLRDDNPTEIVPVLTVAIIAANVAMWLVLQNAGVGAAFRESLCAWGTLPGEVTGALSPGDVVGPGGLRCRVGGARWTTLLSSMFMHGGWAHLIMNMWFLWVFGNNIEDAFGHVGFLLFYLVAGLLGSGAHIASAPTSDVPTVGASGAISGVMGAYLVLYPRVRVDTLVIIVFFIRVFPLPAWLLLGEWFLLQLFYGSMASGAGGGVAFWAHIGGFVAGVAFAFLAGRGRAGAGPRGRRG